MKGRDLGQTPKSFTNFELISLGFEIASCIIENYASVLRQFLAQKFKYIVTIFLKLFDNNI